jgi:hypothetical protein
MPLIDWLRLIIEQTSLGLIKINFLERNEKKKKYWLGM